MAEVAASLGSREKNAGLDPVFLGCQLRIITLSLPLAAFLVFVVALVSLAQPPNGAAPASAGPDAWPRTS